MQISNKYFVKVKWCHTNFWKAGDTCITTFIPGSFGPVFAWYVFSHSFTFSLGMYFYLNWVFWRQYRVMFLNPLCQSLSFNCVFWTFILNVIIGILELVCHFIICFMFFCFSVFFLLSSCVLMDMFYNSIFIYLWCFWVSLCIDCKVVIWGITFYMYIHTHINLLVLASYHFEQM